MLNLKLKRLFRLFLSVLLISTVLTFTVGGVLAITNSPKGDISNLNSEEILDGAGFFSGDSVKIDGKVEGTTFAVGKEIRINGTINGDLFVAGQNIYIDGIVLGNIYCAGQNIKIGYDNSDIKSDAFIAGQYINLNENAKIGRDVFSAGFEIIHEGNIGRNLYSASRSLFIKGLIGNDINADVDHLEVEEGAKIGGNFSYKSPSEATIHESVINPDKIDWEYREVKTDNNNKYTSTNIKSTTISLIGLLLVWIVVEFIRPGFWKTVSQPFSKQPLKSLGIGSLSLILTPIVFIILLITQVGISLGFILGIAYGVFLYISKIIVAVSLGLFIAKRLNCKEIHKGVWLTLLGIVILTICSFVPMLNILVWILTMCAGFGSLVLSIFKRNNETIEN